MIEKAAIGINEILAVNEHEFLVIERDRKAGHSAKIKKIYKIDISQATDITQLASLPKDTIPQGIIPVEKKLFIDLLDPVYGLVNNKLPEKFEGLAFGPDLKDGRHLLLVTTDNDFDIKQPSRFYAFAVDRSDLPEFKSQRFYDYKLYTFLVILGILWAGIGIGILVKKKSNQRRRIL